MGISANGREMLNGRRCGASFCTVIGFFLDMSRVELDGSHTTTLRGGECCGYQGRKKRKTTNVIYVTDSQGIPLAMSIPVSGSHNDLYCISEVLSELFSGLNSSALPISGLFLNADAGFDTERFRRGCHKREVFKDLLKW